jgi:hypothetical protein
MESAALLDASALGDRDGPGRYELKPCNGNGSLAMPAILVDVPDANGEVLPYLTAPISGQNPGAPGVAGVAGVEPAKPDPMVEVWREMAKQAEQGRSNDINAFLKLLEQERTRSAPPESSAMLTFLQKELDSARSTIVARDATIDTLREEVGRLREAAVRSKAGAAAGGDELLNKIGGFLMEKVSGGVASGAGGAATGDMFRIPDAAEMRAMIEAGAIPAEVIKHAVRLHKAGGLPADRWAVIEPIAAMAGLL